MMFGNVAFMSLSMDLMMMPDQKGGLCLVF